MGSVNIYSSNGANKASVQYEGSSDVTVNADHLTGTTSNIQTQLDAKASTSELLAKANIETSATQPSSPSAGDLWFDTSVNICKVYDGSNWRNIHTTSAIGTGGTEYTSGGYKYHVFTSSGTFSVTGGGEIEYLVVAGGGAGGGNDCGGGGGAGGLASGTVNVNPGSYTITVGAGGASNNDRGGNGVASSFGTIVSTIGGGGGGKGNGGSNNGLAGGSGGGGGWGGNSPGAGTSGQGYIGGWGNGTQSGSTSGGGGGGAGAAGAGYSGAPTSVIGNGGIGLNFSEWANATGTGDQGYYAGGGGAGTDTTASTGGLGGGGVGEVGNPRTSAINPQANTGGGGGGGGGYGGSDGTNGASGIVILRYQV